MKLSDKQLTVLWTLRQWGWDIFAVVLIAALTVLVWSTTACPQRAENDEDEVNIPLFWIDESPMSSEVNQCIEPPGYVHDDESSNDIER